MIIIGLTGGIASGKSLAADYFRELGVPVIDTDDLARQVVAIGQPAWLRLRELFSSEYFLPNGELDRRAMAARVFADPEARRTLESVTHPAIFAEVDRQIALLRQRSTPPGLVVVVVPLLFEVGAEARFDRIVLVVTGEDQQIARLQCSRGYTAAEAAARITAQLPLAEKLPRADEVLDNTGSPDALRLHVIEMVNRLRTQVSSEPAP